MNGSVTEKIKLVNADDVIVVIYLTILYERGWVTDHDGHWGTYPRLSPLTTSWPQTQSSWPTRGVHFCACPPGANGFFGSKTQSPPKLFVYINVEPSSKVTLLPVIPEVADEDPGLPLPPLPLPPPDEGDDPFFLVRASATPTATAASTTTRAPTPIRIINVLFLAFFCANVIALSAWVGIFLTGKWVVGGSSRYWELIVGCRLWPLTTKKKRRKD